MGVNATGYVIVGIKTEYNDIEKKLNFKEDSLGCECRKLMKTKILRPPTRLQNLTLEYEKAQLHEMQQLDLKIEAIELAIEKLTDEKEMLLMKGVNHASA